MLVGVDIERQVTGVHVLAHRETPGLGDRIESSKTDWVRQFDGRSLGDPVAGNWKIKRDGGEFDQLTGASVTPRAVVKGHQGNSGVLRRELGGIFADRGRCRRGDRMTTPTMIDRFKTGLWYENPGLVQLLGLCPLLAVTSTFINGLGLGIATLAVLVMSNALVSATRRWIRREIRIPIYVLIIASLVTCTELVFKAWFPALDRSLGIFIPLIVTNCAIVARAEIFASRNPIGSSIVDGLVMGAGFALLLIAIGIFREVVADGMAARHPATRCFLQPGVGYRRQECDRQSRREARSSAIPRRSRHINR